MTPEQMRELEQILTKRRELLESEAHADASKAREDVYSETAGPVTDTSDEATADLISDVENAELSRDLDELREIDSALERMRAASYGTCVECSGEIGLERLRRQPTALRCFDCQSVFEKTFLQPNKPTL